MTSHPGRGDREIEKKSGSAHLARRSLFAVLLFLSAAASFNGFYSKSGFREGDPKRGFEAVVDGSAARPYIYRQLVPVVANWASGIVPSAFERKLASLRSDSGLGFYPSLFSSSTALNPTYSFRYLITYFEVLAWAVLAAFFFYLLCRAEGHGPEISLISASLLILLIPYFQTRGGGYYYDFPEAALVALAVLLARRAHWLWLVPVAFLGTFNKESFILLLVALWPILALRWGRLFGLLQVLVLELVAGGAYFVNRIRFAANPGGTLEFHLNEQIAFLVHPGLWLVKFGKAYGVFLPELGTIVPALLLGLMIWRVWRHISPSMRQCVWLLAAMNVPLFILFCRPGEVRDLSLLYFIVLLSIATTLTQAHRSRIPASVESTRNIEVKSPASWEPVRSDSRVPLCD